MSGDGIVAATFGLLALVVLADIIVNEITR